MTINSTPTASPKEEIVTLKEEDILIERDIISKTESELKTMSDKNKKFGYEGSNESSEDDRGK